MRLANNAVAKINQWIAEDKTCRALKAKLEALRKKRADTLKRFAEVEVNRCKDLARALKGVRYLRLSFDARRQQVNTETSKHIKAMKEASLALRLTLKQISYETQVAAISLGRRQGYLRQNLYRNFVTVAQREAVRLARKSGL